MIFVIYSIPFITSIILLLFFRKQVVWWEYVLIIATSTLVALTARAICISNLEDDVEYLGGYMTRITHEDDWDEWVHETCTREVPDGTDKDGNTTYRTETYDCSHREYHPEHWKYTYKNWDGKYREDYFYSYSEFHEVLKEFGFPKMHFRDMHRDYYTKDGDAQDYYWDGKSEHLRSMVWTHHYKNKVNPSNSIFNFEEISKPKAHKLGLFDYPNVKDDDQDVVLGYDVSPETHKKYKYINSKYGHDYQFRIFLLVFKDKPYDISEKQKSYWKGGNKNEFVLCIGYNSKTDSIEWCNPFSWCDKPLLEVETKQYFLTHSTMAYIKYYPDFLKRNIHLWHRKSFADFDYIQNTLTQSQGITVLIIIFIINALLSVFVVINPARNDDEVYGPFNEALGDWMSNVSGNTKRSIKRWYRKKLIPDLDRIEEFYRKTFTWK